ncbi:MAG: alpha/beta fold hydrolase [Candidatus Limnocylindrales bacterium]
MTDLSLPLPVSAALAAPATGARLTVDAAGIPWSALTWGPVDGRALLLIHGVTSSAANWWRLGPAFAATGRRVVAVDLPGHGLTGHWLGHHRFRDNAADVAAFARGAGLVTAGLQVVGHSWGAVTAAALPAVGLVPSTLVLLDPPAVPHATIAAMAADPDERTYMDLAEAVAAVRRDNPDWPDGDVLAKAESLTQLDEAAARAVVIDNGDWDGGLADLADPAAAGIPVWVVRGDPTAGGLLLDEALPAFQARVGDDHITTIAGAPHSPHRLFPVETTAALLRALEA